MVSQGLAVLVSAFMALATLEVFGQTLVERLDEFPVSIIHLNDFHARYDYFMKIILCTE